jgi:hypothetical protein
MPGPTVKLTADILKSFLLISQSTEPIMPLDGGSKPYGKCKNSEEWLYPRVEIKGENVIYISENYKIIGRIGIVGSNKPFCRVLISEDDKELMFVFRPLNLEGVAEFYRKRSVLNPMAWVAASNYYWHGSHAYKDVSGVPDREKLTTVVSAIYTRTAQTLTGDLKMKKGDVQLCTQMLYKVCDNSRGKSVKNPMSMYDGVRLFIKRYSGRNVTFTGFSLGAEMATACAMLLSIDQGDRAKALNVGSLKLISCCGEAVGNQALVDVLEDKFNHVNIAVENDPVSKIETGSDLVHPSKTVLVRYTGNTKIMYANSPYNVEAQQNSMVLFKNYLSGVSDDFKRYHLSAEFLVPLILWEYLAPKNQRVVAKNNNQLLCEWYNSVAYAMKFGICPKPCAYSKDSQGRGTCGTRLGTRKRRSDEGPERVRRKFSMLGMHTTRLANAEQSYVMAMNDLNEKDAVINDIFRKKRFNAKFIGSYLVARDADDHKHDKDVDAIPIPAMARKLQAYRNKAGTYAFVCGGSFPKKDISHHLAFIWTPKKKQIVGFNPGTGCWHQDLSIQAIEAVSMGTGIDADDIHWDRMGGRYGPQDYTKSMWCRLFSEDAFCQTWSIFWLANYLSGRPAESWPTNANKLNACIRRFVLWILHTFPRILHVANYEFLQIYPDEAGDNKRVIKALTAGYKDVGPEATIGYKKGDFSCPN